MEKMNESMFLSIERLNEGETRYSTLEEKASNWRDGDMFNAYGCLFWDSEIAITICLHENHGDISPADIICRDPGTAANAPSTQTVVMSCQ